MKIIKLAQAKRVRAEYWESVGEWVLVDADKPRSMNLRPLGIPWERGIGQDLFTFPDREEAEQAIVEKGWEVVK